MMGQQKTKENHHKTDLKEAIEYLPPSIRADSLCSALKLVYGEDGKELALKWLHETKNSVPINFESFWDEIKHTSYQKKKPGNYLKGIIYDRAKKTGWIPKRLRHGKQTKKPPSKRKQKKMAADMEADQRLKENLTENREKHLNEEEKSFIAPCIKNMFGGCYVHPFMKKDEIPVNEGEYKRKLDKIVDCEVRVVEANEIVQENHGRQPDDLEVRYTLELNNKAGKYVKAVITHEELTTKTRFSNFLVKHGFVKFLGKTNDFDRFHEFLINEQEYPTIRQEASWGEFKPGEYLFENGIYSTTQNQFIPQNDSGAIPFKGKLLVCPNGSEQVKPPALILPNQHSAYFLAESFRLWESFNGSINVRVTIGYAVACVFSRQIVESYKGFPLLFKYGARGTGKSNSMDWFMALFGHRSGNRQSISKQNTMVSIKRRMTLPRGFPFFLDDYRNHETNSNVPDLTSPMLNWYERVGSGMGKATTDHQTIDTPMRACVVMTGNDRPSDPAAASRLLILNYKQFLKRDQLKKLPKITSHLDRFSEFLGLLFENYKQVQQTFFTSLEESRDFLADQQFEGRVMNNWAIALAGIRSIEHIISVNGECYLPEWIEDFKSFREDLCGYIQRQQSLQQEYNPIHEFFSAIEYYATQKKDIDSDANDHRFVLDHRHFRRRDGLNVQMDDGQTYTGQGLAIHLQRTWNALEVARAPITNNTTYQAIVSNLENSCYFLDKSVQVPLTKSLQTNDESNVRCYLLNVEQCAEKGMLTDLLEKAGEYEINRKNRIF
ncbi:MAG: hypothetical protein GVY20_14420 [Bacteroidetes bacterium]|nr:hypothetical protein [Bacteroidota bacterium]